MYAIVGSAAFTASVTRCLSVAIIIFELSSSVTLVVPVMLGVLVSYSVSNSLSIGVFDVLLEIKGIPYVPTLKSVSDYSLVAKDIMAKNFIYLTNQSTIQDVMIFLKDAGYRPRAIPVLKND